MTDVLQVKFNNNTPFRRFLQAVSIEQNILKKLSEFI